ncbi:hypothetical protein BRD17_00935, partial [Halobacteriales archaeon SW_7_68_16]
MRRGSGIAFAVFALAFTLVSTLAVGPVAADPGGTNDTAPPDPETDVIGWENGRWHNETLAVDPANGLNDTELTAVTARGMARTEEIRRLEFEETPPVEVITREQYRTTLNGRFENRTPAERLHQNVKYEATMMVGEDTDAVAVQRSNLGSGVLGYYDPETGNVTIVSENTTAPRLDEITLSQELFHALQDQRYNISSYNQTTRELHNAVDGIIEGDGNYVDTLYNRRCDEEWNGTCLRPGERPTAAGDRHLGLLLITLQPYSDGPVFVRELYEREGWDAVNAIYERPPESTEQTIHTDAYRTDSPTPVSVPDRSGANWSVLDLNDSIDYASFGEAGLYATLWYPGYESDLAVQIIPYANLLDFPVGAEPPEIDPYDYNHTTTAGWDGDKLVPYVRGDSMATNETGYVWRLVWDTSADAAEFREGYRQLVEYHGAEPVEGHRNTYRIADGEAFGDAFYVTRRNATMTIVNAPSVAALDGVRAGAAPRVDDDGSTDEEPTDRNPDDDGSTDREPTDRNPDDDGSTDEEPTDRDPGATMPDDGTNESAATTPRYDVPSMPGFGSIVAVVALLVAALL